MGELLSSDAKTCARALAQGCDAEGYFIFDRQVAELFQNPPYFVSGEHSIAPVFLRDYRRCQPDFYHRAGNLDDLARTLGMEFARL